MASNTYEEAARERKVSAMVSVIDRAATEKGVGVEQIINAFERWTAEDWKRVDRLAQLKTKSSDTTKKAVIQRFRDRLNLDAF